jgi:hypothetical protein
MQTIPLLKSGQLAQYPFRCSIRQSVETVAFLDGQEQRCATMRPLHEWTIQLGLVDEQELGALEVFVEQQQGQVGMFQFTDPADGLTYENCTLSLDVLDETFRAPGRAMTVLVIRENPD